MLLTGKIVSVYKIKPMIFVEVICYFRHLMVFWAIGAAPTLYSKLRRVGALRNFVSKYILFCQTKIKKEEKNYGKKNDIGYSWKEN